MKRKKICFFTGTRAEYGLLQPLINELAKEISFELQIIITGMHLSEEFGYTEHQIEKSPFSKVKKIEILLSSDSQTSVAKAMGLGLINFSEALKELHPDLLIGLGDRFELISVVSTSTVMNIPIAHISGGELTYGAYDDAFRHAITKMSHLHFTSTEQYRKRVIQMGENPKRVFNIGALGIDNIKNLELLTKVKLEKELSFELNKPYFVVTFHPVTREKDSSIQKIKNIFSALENFPKYKIIFTKSNADNEGRRINRLIDEFVKKNVTRAKAFDSLGPLKYLSTLKYASAMIGNSSSGIVEMPYFKKPTVNIGNRQKGRIFPETVIQSKEDVNSITNSIKKAISEKFNEKLKSYKNIYGNGNAAKKIKKILLKTNFSKLIEKEFYDLNFNIK